MFLIRITGLWVILLLNNEFTLAFSGLFTDNGFGQTVMKEEIPHAGALLMRDHILDLFGLPDPPPPDRLSPIRRKSIPKFLLEIYKQLKELEEENGPIENEDQPFFQPRRRRRSMDENIEITYEHAKIIEMSDTIMTFSNNWNAFAAADSNETRLSFDLSEVISNGTELLMSELHLFKRRFPEKQMNSNLCEIIISGATFVDGIKQLHTIHVESTTVDYEGWIRVNFTSVFEDWILSKRSSNLLYITIQYEDDEGHLATPSVDANYLLSYWDREHQPFITAFFKNDQSSDPKVGRPRLKNRRSKRSVLFSNASTKVVNPLIHRGKVAVSNRCQRYILYVSFRELRYDDWIIAPSGYGAFYCAGPCNFPFSPHVKATNHAMVQALVSLGQSSLNPPCCAPSKLRPVSLLYSQNEEITHIKRMPKMVATECACQ